MRRRHRRGRREQQQHARAREHLPRALFAGASHPDGIGSAIGMGPRRRDGGRDRRHLDAGGRDRSRRAAALGAGRGAPHDVSRHDEPPMMTRSRAWTNWLLVVVFATGMAWVEAACVYYLRAMVDRLEPYQANPLPMHGGLGPVELVREAATLVMLLAVGGIAGRTRINSIGYTAIECGLWAV